MRVAEPPTLKMNEMLRQLNSVVTGGGVCIRMAAYGAARAGHPAACPSSPTIPTIIPGTPSSPLRHVQKGIFILCSDWTHIMLVTPAIIQCDNRNLLVPMCVNAERFNGVCYNYSVCNSRRMRQLRERVILSSTIPCVLSCFLLLVPGCKRMKEACAAQIEVASCVANQWCLPACCCVGGLSNTQNVSNIAASTLQISGSRLLHLPFEDSALR